MKAEPKRCTARGNLVRDTGTGAPTEDKLYGSTFCATCRDYFRVGRDGEFVWDRQSMQRVGTRRSA
jgi:hypothetical protein